MALLLRDGFDFYTLGTDAALNFWDATDNGVSLVTSAAALRFGVGKAFRTFAGTGSGAQIATHFANCTTLFITGSHAPSWALGGTTNNFGWRIFDGAGVVQCSIYFNSSGDIRFYRGDGGGTLLGTYVAGYLGGAVWTHFQFKIVIGTGTAGEFHVRKNGNTSDDYTLTGVNNAASGAAQMNRLDMNKSANNVSIDLDDVAIYDSTGSAPWNDWVGDIRAVQIMPNSDSAVQFTRQQSTLSEGNTTSTSTRTIAINLQSTLLSFTPLHSGALANLILQFNAAATGNVNCAIFDSAGAGGGPGSVLTNGTCTPVTNPVINANTFTFATPPNVVAGTTYWLMFITNVSSTLKSTTGNVQNYSQAKTYAAGAFDSPMTLTSTSLQAVNVTATITIANNYQLVMELGQDGATSYVYSSTVGHVDLYGNPGMNFTPTSILGLSIRGFATKSDAGSRSGAWQIKSSATVVDGPTLALPTSYQNMAMVQDTDPATAAAWTPTGVGSALFGPKVVV